MLVSIVAEPDGHMTIRLAFDHTCHFFMAFDPAMFGDPADIKARMSLYLKRLRESERIPGCDRIYTAGEKAFEAKAKREASGIPVEENTLKELDAIADALHVARLER